MRDIDNRPSFFSSQVSEAKRFYLDLEPAVSTRLSVVSGGCEHCAADYEVSRSDFSYLSVEFVAGGKGELLLGKQRCSLTPGVVFTYGPGVRHRIVTDSANPLVKYFVDFAGKDAPGLMRRCGIEPGTMIQTSSPNELIVLFDDLIRNGARNTRFSAKICTLLLEHLALKIAETAMPLGTANTQAFATYRRCRQYIQDRFMSLGTLEQIALECSVNAAYLCRLFRRFDSERPYQFLIRMKMNRAGELLQMQGAMVKQVAEDMGFDDQFHFSRTFRHVFGVPPSRFITLRDGQKGLFLDSASVTGRLRSAGRTSKRKTS